jgi:hypothetical protein
MGSVGLASIKKMDFLMVTITDHYIDRSYPDIGYSHKKLRYREKLKIPYLVATQFFKER